LEKEKQMLSRKRSDAPLFTSAFRGSIVRRFAVSSSAALDTAPASEYPYAFDGWRTEIFVYWNKVTT
jgi:hypothetical protein